MAIGVNRRCLLVTGHSSLVTSSRLLLGDGHRDQLVSLLEGVHYFLALPNLTEHGVFAVQPISRDVGHKKLAAVGIRAGVRHR